MNIDKLIKREAPGTDQHDISYRQALLKVYVRIKNSSKEQLIEYQKLARYRYAKEGATHQNTARCIVIYELLK